MNYHKFFPKPRRIFVVINVKKEEGDCYPQLFKNCEIAFQEGVSGVFLRGLSGITYEDLLAMQYMVKHTHPLYWSGLSPAKLSQADVNGNTYGAIDGLWVETIPTNVIPEEYRHNMKIIRGWNRLLFGSVVLKAGWANSTVAKKVRKISKYTDVLVVCSDKPDTLPEIEHIVTIKNAIGRHPLAVFGGVTLNNVNKYKSVVDCLIVSKCVCVDGDSFQLDPEKVRKIVQNTSL